MPETSNNEQQPESVQLEQGAPPAVPETQTEQAVAEAAEPAKESWDAADPPKIPKSRLDREIAKRRGAAERVAELLAERKDFGKRIAELEATVGARDDSLRILDALNLAICRQLEQSAEAKIAAETQDKQVFVERLRKLYARLQGQPLNFEGCMQAIGEIPMSWIRAIVELPNAADFLVFLARAASFRDYLNDLKEPAAIVRIRQAAYDLEQHFSRTGEPTNGGNGRANNYAGRR